MNLEQKQQHPIASQIPINLWSKYCDNFPEDWDSNKAQTSSLATLKRDDLPESSLLALIVVLIMYHNSPADDLASYALSDTLHIDHNEVCYILAAIGRLDILNDLVQRVFNKDTNRIIQGVFHSFYSDDHLEIAKGLLTQFPNQIQAMIDANIYEAFRESCLTGQLDKTKWWFEQLPNQRQAMIKANNYESFRFSCCDTHLETAKWLFEQSLPEQIQQMIEMNHYDAFRFCCNQGDFKAVQWLLEQSSAAQRQKMITANNYDAFRGACYNSHINIAERLFEQLSPDDGQGMIAANHYTIFHFCCYKGKLESVKWLLRQLPLEQRQTVIAADNYALFHGSCTKGHLDIANLLFMELLPEQRKTMMDTQIDKIFTAVCSNGHLDIAKWLLEKLLPEQRKTIMNTQIDKVFTAVCSNGHLALAEWLLKTSSPHQRQKMITENHYLIFDDACSKGYLSIAMLIMKQLPAEQRRNMIHTHGLRICHEACSNGYFSIAKWLVECLVSEQYQHVTTQDVYKAFRQVCLKNSFEMLQWILQQFPQHSEAVIATNSYDSYNILSRNGNIEALRWLIQEFSGDRQKMLDNYARAFRLLCHNNHDEEAVTWLIDAFPSSYSKKILSANRYEVCHLLCSRGYFESLKNIIEELSRAQRQEMIAMNNYRMLTISYNRDYFTLTQWLLNDTGCLAYAERHAAEYAVVNFYVNQLITSLKNQYEVCTNKRRFFDLSEEDAMHAFYLLRHLIRQNKPDNHENIVFLLSIPAIRSLAHQSLRGDSSNELLRLALRLKNQDAVDILLTLKEVKTLADKNDCYRAEMAEQDHVKNLTENILSHLHYLSPHLTDSTTHRAKYLAQIFSDCQLSLKEKYGDDYFITVQYQRLVHRISYLIRCDQKSTKFEFFRHVDSIFSDIGLEPPPRYLIGRPFMFFVKPRPDCQSYNEADNSLAPQ